MSDLELEPQSPLPLKPSRGGSVQFSNTPAPAATAFESPFLPLIHAVDEDDVFGPEDEDDDEEEDSMAIAAQLSLQQRLRQQQQNAVQEQQQRRQREVEEQKQTIKERQRELEEVKRRIQHGGEEPGQGSPARSLGRADGLRHSGGQDAEDDDTELTPEELQQLMEARARSPDGAFGSAKGQSFGRPQGYSSPATIMTSLTRRANSTYPMRPASEAAKQGQRIREATAATRAAEDDVQYWTNRVKMLKHEMDKTIVKIEEARRLHDITEVSAVLNERTRQALDEQKEYQEKLLEAKRLLNRQRRRELKERSWQARLAHFEENWGARESLKAEKDNNQRIIGQLRYEELQDNIKRREEAQQQKMVSLMKRVQDRAEKEDEAHRRFEDRINRTKQREEQKTQEALALIKESALLMQHLQALKEEHVAVAGRIDPNLMASVV
eukprot:EG_transcript_8285